MSDPPQRTIAKHLRVRVSQDGRVKVDLTFPAAVAANLPALIPEDVVGGLTERGLDPAAIAVDVAARNFPPGELFALDSEGKQIRVWLE